MPYLGSAPGNAALTSAQIADGAVSSAKIADDAISSAKIADDAITAAKVADDAITSAQIADDAVTSARIADDAITAAKIASGAVDVPASDNLIINGNHVVSQRGTSFSSVGASDSEFLTDRWKVRSISSASARWTVTRETGGGLSREDSWMKIENTTPDASPGADETQWITQPVEGFNMTSVIADDNTVKSMTVSLDIIAHAGSGSSISFPAKVAIGVDLPQGASREIVNDVTVTAADTWQRVSFTLAADSFTGWGALTSANLALNVMLYGGSNRVCTANTWQTMGRDTVTSNTSNWADAADNYIGFTNVQVNPGTANTFRRESYSSQAVKCRRYFWRAAEGNNAAMPNGTQNSTTGAWAVFMFQNPMCYSPTINYSSLNHFGIDTTAGAVDPTGLVRYYQSINSVWVNLQFSSSGSDGDAVRWYTDDSAATFDIIAEL